MQAESLSLPTNPENFSPDERLRFWKQKAVELYKFCLEQNIPIIFRGSLHAEALKTGFLKDGYKEEKKQWRDIDIYLPVENLDRDLVKTLEEISYPIPIGLSGNGIIQLIDDSYFLTYKDVSVPLEKRLLNSCYLEVNGVALPFFDPQVHFHLFGTIGFANRRRDIGKKQLYKAAKSPYKELSEAEYRELFLPFKKYRLMRAKRYPIETLLHKVRGNIPVPKNMLIRKISKKLFSVIDRK